jgi:hypothetical protein
MDISDNYKPLKTLYDNKHKIAPKTCITKCYPKHNEFVHPYTLSTIKNTDFDVCATHPYLVKTNSGTNSTYVDIGKCDLKDNENHNIPNEIMSVFSSPINNLFILVSIYNCYTFDEVITWTLDNSGRGNKHQFTIDRVHLCAWDEYGKYIHNITISVMVYFYDMAINFWLTMYPFKSQHTKLIITNYLTFPFFVKTIKKYITENYSTWNVKRSIPHSIQISFFLRDELLKIIPSHIIEE